MTQPALLAQADRLAGGLRHLLPRLSRAHLCLVLGWTEKQLEQTRLRGAPSLTLAPNASDGLVFDGDVAILLATVRHHLAYLPTSHLVLLTHWVEQELERASERDG